MLPNYDDEPFRGIPHLSGNGEEEFIRFYNNTGGALTAGTIKLVSTMVDITDSSNPILSPILIAPATNAAQMNIVAVVSDTSVANGAWGNAKIRGFIQALCNGGTDIVKGDQLEILNGGTAFTMSTSATVTSSTVGTGTILDANCAAISAESYATGTDALKWVYLVGLPVVVAAS